MRGRYYLSDSLADIGRAAGAFRSLTDRCDGQWEAAFRGGWNLGDDRHPKIALFAVDGGYAEEVLELLKQLHLSDSEPGRALINCAASLEEVSNVNLIGLGFKPLQARAIVELATSHQQEMRTTTKSEVGLDDEGAVGYLAPSAMDVLLSNNPFEELKSAEVQFRAAAAKAKKILSDAMRSPEDLNEVAAAVRANEFSDEFS